MEARRIVAPKLYDTFQSLCSFRKKESGARRDTTDRDVPQRVREVIYGLQTIKT